MTAQEIADSVYPLTDGLVNNLLNKTLVDIIEGHAKYYLKQQAHVMYKIIEILKEGMGTENGLDEEKLMELGHKVVSITHHLVV